MKIWCPNP